MRVGRLPCPCSPVELVLPACNDSVLVQSFVPGPRSAIAAISSHAEAQRP